MPDDNESEHQGPQHLNEIIPVIRGLLADRTDDEDNPYQPVILNYSEYGSLEGAQGEHPALELDIEALESKDIRSGIETAIGEYCEKYKSGPEVVCVKDFATLRVDRGKIDSSLPLKNKVALVTGSAGAIGFGICKGLLESGCYLVASDLGGERLGAFVDDLKSIEPERVIGVGLDVTDGESINNAFETVTKTWGGIDILVHNAGIAMVSHLKDIDVEEFRGLEKVNVEGTLLILKAISGHFRTQATGGDIIIMSSKNVPSPGAGFGGYSATKAACHQLGRIASLEFAQYGVRVNMVAPDAVFSEGKYASGLWAKVGPDRMKARGLDEQGLQEFYRNRNLLKARVTGKHVANAVLFFATRKTPTTGATIPVDGGLPDATPR